MPWGAEWYNAWVPSKRISQFGLAVIVFKMWSIYTFIYSESQIYEYIASLYVVFTYLRSNAAEK